MSAYRATVLQPYCRTPELTTFEAVRNVFEARLASVLRLTACSRAVTNTGSVHELCSTNCDLGRLTAAAPTLQ